MVFVFVENYSFPWTGGLCGFFVSAHGRAFSVCCVCEVLNTWVDRTPFFFRMQQKQSAEGWPTLDRRVFLCFRCVITCYLKGYVEVCGLLK